MNLNQIYCSHYRPKNTELFEEPTPIQTFGSDNADIDYIHIYIYNINWNTLKVSWNRIAFSSLSRWIQWWHTLVQQHWSGDFAYSCPQGAKMFLLYRTKSTCCLGHFCRWHHISVVVQLFDLCLLKPRWLQQFVKFVKLQWKYLKLISDSKVSLKICQHCSVIIFTLNGGPAVVLSKGGSSHVCLARVIKKLFTAFIDNELLSCIQNSLLYLYFSGCSYQEVYPNLLVRNITPYDAKHMKFKLSHPSRYVVSEIDFSLGL